MIFKTVFSLHSLVVITMILFGLKFILKNKGLQEGDSFGVKIGNAQDKGARKRQEDSFATIRDDNKTLVVVADGMGGFNSGKKASKLVTKNFMEEFCRTYNMESKNYFLINTLYDSNEKLLEILETERVGTTLIAALVDDNLLYWLSVGDSHLYLSRNQELTKLNTDHIFAKELEKSYQVGEISRYRMLNHPQRERLVSYVGQSEIAELDYSYNPVELERGDRIMLCTDGIYNSLSEVEISQLLGQTKGMQQLAEEIVEEVLVKELPEQDNATVIILEKD